ncbi:PhzF family phenazine biosynthesis protein [Variovorax sp. J31P179]|uniref:PhzF family phenazine biosynthesis protein n=1 Tax=Variovorax sp. J31P179 TaxID=3053508 RepID=UPI002577EC23|nr:PhzF family phenazine biosynthesis protein [Variovorax sp. J31P179]MDM0081504.1 PhzF family phenazine biosynthesis protein [Variovorax sp. J31P179]
MKVERFAAFSDGQVGGNPAGVVLCDALPLADVMQAVAAEVGYSETVFAAPTEDGWRVRYFAPESEVAFCGHATIALGAALAQRLGDGVFKLQLNAAAISVEGHREGATVAAALQSPPTASRPASDALVDTALALFSYRRDDLDPRIPPAIANAGLNHLVLALRSRARLAAMRYELEAGRTLMTAEGIGTISLVHAQTPRCFHARNPFAIGGVYEDPATGAAAAALGGYLRDLGWSHEGAIEIIQGEDMGMRSRLRVEISPAAGASVRVSGSARVIVDPSRPST